ncbi:MAG: hypothetical protein RLZ14_2163, partial [Actinomycetota bacterium]
MDIAKLQQGDVVRSLDVDASTHRERQRRKRLW